MNCPFCAEPVEAEDEKCRSCGEFLEERSAADSSSPAKTIFIVLGVLFGIFALACLLFAGAGFLSYRSVKIAMNSEMARMDLEGLAAGSDQYKAGLGSYPQQLQDLWQDPGVKGWSGPYWVTMNSGLDPWGNPWVYATSTAGFTITSYGADGAPGGIGEDADIVVSRP